MSARNFQGVCSPAMADNWDDDDFEPEVTNLAPPPQTEDLVPDAAAIPAPQPSKPKPKSKQKDIPTFSMELGRELTEKEKEEIQRRSDFSFAKELFGGGEEDDEHMSYENIMSKEEFEMWGEKIARFIATRKNAGHYGDLLCKLLNVIAAPMEAAEIRKMSNLLKAIADEKKATADKEKKGVVGATKGGGKGKAKPSMKAAGGKGVKDDMEYEFGGGGHDDYDDFM